MCIKKRTLVARGVAVLSLALLVGVLGVPETTRPAAAQVDRCDALQQEVDALNRGEIDLDDYADDLVFRTTGPCAQEDCVGKDAYRNFFEYQVDMNLQMTITSCEASGDTVAFTYEAVMDSIRAAGVDRVISRATYTYQGDKIVAVGGQGFDLTDPQTLQYVQYAMARPRPSFEMGPGRDADQSPGTAELPGYPDFVIVFVRIAPGPSGVPQPMHIHEGTCANLGPVAFALRNVDGGVSYTVLRGLALTDLQTGNFAIAVQQSQDKPDVYVACADIPAVAQADRCEKFQQGIDAFNRGEIDLLLENVADDMVVVAAPLCAPEGCVVGKDGFRNHLECQVALDTQLTVTSCEVSGSTIAVTWEMRGRDVREAGVDRIIVFEAWDMEGDKVVSARSVGVDMEDPQTAQYVTWVVVHGVVATFAMGPGRDADQSPGAAVLERYPDFSVVRLRIAPGPTGVSQPVNIHEGTCADLGPVAFALKDMAGGVSQTVLDGVPGSDLQTGNLAIAVQKSHDEPDVYVACGDILAAAAPAVAPALPAAGSGGLLTEQGSWVPTWWYALAAGAAGGGVLLTVGAWYGRRRWLR